MPWSQTDMKGIGKKGAGGRGQQSSLGKFTSKHSQRGEKNKKQKKLVKGESSTWAI